MAMDCVFHNRSACCTDRVTPRWLHDSPRSSVTRTSLHSSTWHRVSLRSWHASLLVLACHATPSSSVAVAGAPVHPSGILYQTGFRDESEWGAPLASVVVARRPGLPHDRLRMRSMAKKGPGEVLATVQTGLLRLGMDQDHCTAALKASSLTYHGPTVSVRARVNIPGMHHVVSPPDAAQPRTTLSSPLNGVFRCPLALMTLTFHGIRCDHCCYDANDSMDRVSSCPCSPL